MPNGVPTPPFATRMIPPASRMGPLTDPELARYLDSPQVKKYAQAIDRESAREKLAKRVSGEQAQMDVRVPGPSSEALPIPPAAPRGRAPKPEPSLLETVLKSPTTRTVAGQITRGLLGALLGTSRRTRSRW